MTFKTLSALLAAAVLSAFAAPAHAVSVPSEAVMYTLGGPVQTGVDINFNDYYYNRNERNRTLDTAVGDVYLKNAAIVRDTRYDTLYSSRKPDGLNARDNYLAVFGSIEHLKPSSATFELNGGYNTFSFLWGSIDWYNKITVEDMNGDKFTLTGQYLLNTNASLVDRETTTYFSITDLDGIKRIIISSTFDAFEMARVTLSNVPLPAALPMFGMALAGLAFARRRQKAAKA